MSKLILIAGILVVAGCAGMRPLKGGTAVTTPGSAGGIAQTIVQRENPAQVTSQGQKTVKVRMYTMPAGSRIGQTSVQRGATNLHAVIVSAPMQVEEREESRAKTELGAAQKDTARELSAKLSSLKGILWVGLLLFVFGLASMFYLPLKAIIGSVTTSAAFICGGLALMVMPSLVVGNELLILGAVGLSVGGWFLAHRHGELRAKADLGRSSSDT